MISAFAETADNVYRTRFEGTMNLHRVPVKFGMIGKQVVFVLLFVRVFEYLSGRFESAIIEIARKILQYDFDAIYHLPILTASKIMDIPIKILLSGILLWVGVVWLRQFVLPKHLCPNYIRYRSFQALCQMPFGLLHCLWTWYSNPHCHPIPYWS